MMPPATISVLDITYDGVTRVRSGIRQLRGGRRQLLAFPPEGCQSGRMGRPRKPLWPPGHRGFESHTFRRVMSQDIPHSPNPLAWPNHRVREEPPGATAHGRERVGVDVEEPHEVVHRQLRPTLQQVEQADRPVRAFECVRLVDADHRQRPPVGVHPVARLGELLLLGRANPVAEGTGCRRPGTGACSIVPATVYSRRSRLA